MLETHARDLSLKDVLWKGKEREDEEKVIDDIKLNLAEIIQVMWEERGTQKIDKPTAALMVYF